MTARWLLLASMLLIPACTGSGELYEPAQTPAEASYAAPWPDRPVVDLRFDFSSGLSTVEGSQTVTFTAQERVCELVFRLWANKPALVSLGNELQVTRTTVDTRRLRPAYAAAGAPASTQASLMRLPVAGCVQPGQSTTATVDFVLRLGEHSRERVGRSSDLAWLGTGFPMLAWQRDLGWATNPVVDQGGEMVSSEEFELRRLELVVPESYEVLGTGEPLGREAGPQAGTVVERFTAESVRDVAVTVGELETYDLEVEDGPTIHIGGPAEGTGITLADWADEVARAVTEIAAEVGPYPSDDLWVSVLPDCPTGIEFPGAIQFADLPAGHSVLELLVSHEVAHMWFYGLVGNNQGTSPWLDEALATYTQQLVDGELSTVPPEVPQAVRNRVGQPMTWYARPATRDAYGDGVYRQGAAMLAEAREAIGAEVFDGLLREYVATNAHAIATPEDFAAAFAGEPDALAVFRRYGALPPDDP